LLPVSAAIGMASGLSAVHFGVMVVSNLIIGLVTPPVGTTLFVAAGVGRVQPSEVIRYIFPFLGIMVLVQLLVIFVPAVTTALPSLM
jgi:TRAP-type C4-dicarboxylate transport system permease large subunit